MMRLVCALALLAASVAHGADRLVIVPSEGGECRLLLPRDFLKRHEATPIKRQSITIPTIPTVLAGFALAVAVILTGLLLARKPAPRLITGSIACVLTGMLILNSSCSPRPSPIRNDDPNHHRRQSQIPFRPTQPPVVNADGKLSGEMLLEEGSLGDALRLVIDQDSLQGLKEK